RILQNIFNALKPGARFITTVLNACRLIRAMSDDDVHAGKLNLITMIEHSEIEITTPKGKKKVAVRERLYTPAEFVRMLRQVGFSIDHVYGGTAGNWRREALELDEIEFMVIAHKPE
ncbi:MAG: class I SAM-dependent methyltransferase, partial [bacterium]